jgi:hypothetical protein
MFQLCYISRSTKPMSSPELKALLEQSRERNDSLGVTGLLLYDNGSFIQLLEGPAHAVRQLFGKISSDPRHADAQVLFQANVEQRTFPEWEMGYCDPRSEMLRSLPGYSTFFSPGFSLIDFCKGAKARLFFMQFRDGIWRSKLEMHPINAFATARV